MKHHNKLKMIVLVVLVCLLTSLCSMMAFAVQQETTAGRTIRIGCIDYEGFFDKQEDGSYTGYGVDFLTEISKYTGWQYEYVYDTFDNNMNSVKNGTVDFICHAQKTDEREKNYLFSKYSDGSEASVLYVRNDDDRFFYNDFENFNGMTIAVLKGSFQNPVFAEYAHKKGFSFKFKEYVTSGECFLALQNKEVDAVATGSLALRSDFKIICRFGSDPFYFITGKMNQDIMDDLDDALGQITGTNPYFQANLYQKYYGGSISSNILLSREESNYIKNAGTITVGLIANRDPLSYQDENNKAAGMTVDLMNLVAEKSGLKFDYEFLQNGQTGYDYLLHTDAKLVAGVMESDFSTPNPQLLQSDNLQEGSIVFVGRKGETFDPKANLVVALSSAFIGGEGVINRTYPNFKFYTGETNDVCLKAIVDGKADVMLQNMYVVRNALQSPRYEKLEMFPAYTFSENMKVVALPDEDVLMSIVNKTIASFTSDQKNDIVIKYTVAKSYSSTFNDIMYKYHYPLMGLILLIAIIVCMLIVMNQRKQKNLQIMTKKNEQLASAVAQANNANLAKSQFLARMSHEIRTPMNAIVGLTTIADHHRTEPDKIEEYLGKIEVSSKVLLNIINDILDMSAIESNKIKIAHDPFDMREMMTGISAIYYPQCKQKKIQFEMNTASVIHEKLLGDGLRVNQVLLNLVSNAYKFTPEGGKILITVKEDANQDDKAFFTFYVADTGEGMSEEMTERIFKPFEQESAATAAKHGGSGLGLSIAENLIELMAGSISVVSKKGKGTTFKVSLPFDINKDYVADDITKYRTLRALIVDDDADSREYISLVLARIGVPYDVAENGTEAISKLQNAKNMGSGFDICFVDWKMPDMTGGEVTLQIRNMFAKDTLVIIVSAYDAIEIENLAIKCGADMFVTKPLFQSTVFNVLMKLSGGKYINRSEQALSYDFSGKKVLLAEDIELNAEITIELLNMVNMNVDHARNGREALEMFESAAPDTYAAILMDIQMPIMNGYDAAREIRKSTHPDAKKIQIFAMTANAFTEDISEALNSGMNGHIAKPIDSNLLYATLNKIVNSK